MMSLWLTLVALTLMSHWGASVVRDLTESSTSLVTHAGNLNLLLYNSAIFINHKNIINMNDTAQI
jgi:hypothetical protein